MTALAGRLSHTPLQQAVCSSRPLSRQRLLENLFAWVFQGLVYPQIWEDPEIDLEALALNAESRVITIASGGCNVLSYLTADVAHITAVDLNKAHVALSRLKLAAAAQLPSWTTFYHFFGKANEKANTFAYWRFLAPHLDEETRAYWESRSKLGFGPRRLSLFSRDIYRHGLLGRFIGLCHAVARSYGVDPSRVLAARSREEQRQIFASDIAPLFDKPMVRRIIAQPFSLYGLGIPPAQYESLASESDAIGAVLRGRVEKLICGFDLRENYFAWQAFGRKYADAGKGPLPLYLQRKHYEAIRSRVDRVDVVNASYTDYLAGQPGHSVDRYILLDAQDWMTDAQLNALWREITRTARPSARVIFRTAAERSLLPGRLDRGLLDQWRYEAALSRDLTARDRSAIYGGFHLYVLKAAA